MISILFVHTNKELLDKWKSIVMPLSGKCRLYFTHLVEEALEQMDEFHVDIVVCGNDLEIMNCMEFFRIIQISNPEVLKFLCMDISDIEETLKILNATDIHHLITLPLYFQEDLLNPLTEAVGIVEQRNRRKNSDSANENNSNTLLKKDMLRMGDHVQEIVDRNIMGTTEEGSPVAEKKRRLIRFYNEIYHIFLTEYLTQSKEPREMFQDLIKRYHNEEEEQILEIAWNIESTINPSSAGKLCFAADIMCALCKDTLGKYRIKVVFTTNEQGYVMKFKCDYDEGMQADSSYHETSPVIREGMHRLVSLYLKLGYAKGIKGYEGNPYIAVAVVNKEV